MLRWPFAIVMLFVCGGCHTAPAGAEPTRHLAVAEAAGRWLVAEALTNDQAAEDGQAWSWAACPDNGGPAVHNLYSGGAGVVLLFAELHAATGDVSWRRAMHAAARGLAGNLDAVAEKSGGGLFTGIGGMLLALQIAWERTGDPELDAAVVSGMRWYWQRAAAIDHGGPVSFGPVTDVISGDAGIGELMLWFAERRTDLPALEIAQAVAQHLVAIAEESPPGYRWLMSRTYARAMPNYSHGTGGVAAFLARFGREHPGKLAKAMGGGQRLLALRDARGMVFHHQPGGEDLFYWGWCHGPAGTSVLFSRLANATGDDAWRDAAVRPVDSVLASGLPAKRLPGLWNTVGQCCGTAGVGSYLLRAAPEREDALQFCEALADDIRARATEAGDGLKWIQAEHRVRPDLLQAQVGWAQGASGIALWFLELDGRLRGRPSSFELPWATVQPFVR